MRIPCPCSERSGGQLKNAPESIQPRKTALKQLPLQNKQRCARWMATPSSAHSFAGSFETRGPAFETVRIFALSELGFSAGSG